MARGRDALTDLEAEVRRWREDPEYFVRGVLGVETLWRKQVEILEALRDHPRVAVTACHDSSKTFTASCAAWWWALSMQPSKVISTAPSQRQVEDLLWTEIKSRHVGMERNFGGRMKVPAPLTLSWHMDRMTDPDWFMVGFATRPDDAAGHATRMVGYHSPNLMLIFDEAGGIPRVLWDSAEGLMTSECGASLLDDTRPHARWLAIGNPTDPTSEFARAWKSSDWHSIRIDALEHPNVREDANLGFGVAKAWVESMRRKWGETSPLWLSKVRGMFPNVADDTLISISDMQVAMARTAPPYVAREGAANRISLGVDVARFGSDETVVAVVDGGAVRAIESRQGQDTMSTAGRVLAVAKEYGLEVTQARRISVDDTGVGGGVVDRLRELGWSVNAENFGESPRKDASMFNRRTELWWNLREWIRARGCLEGTPQEWQDRLLEDLTTPKYKQLSDGRIALEKKADLKQRTGRSPDWGDALALALACNVGTFLALAPKFDREERDDRDSRREPTVREQIRAVMPSGRGLADW